MLGATTFSTMTLNIMKLRITLGIMTLSIMTLTLKPYYGTLSRTDTHHNNLPLNYESLC